MTGFGGAAAQFSQQSTEGSSMEADVAKVKETMLGNWESNRLGGAAEQKSGPARSSVLSQARL